MTVIAIPLHIITTVLHNRANSKLSEGLGGVEGAPAALIKQPQQQQVRRPEGQVAPLNGWVSISSSSSSAGAPTDTTTATSSSYLSHPSPYQPPIVIAPVPLSTRPI